MSSLPCSRLICANKRSRSPKSDTSPWTPVTFRPICLAAAVSSASRRPVTKTCAPSFTNCFAVARPMPLLPPVMSAIFPSSLPIGGLPASVETLRRLHYHDDQIRHRKTQDSAADRRLQPSRARVHGSSSDQQQDRRICPFF